MKRNTPTQKDMKTMKIRLNTYAVGIMKFKDILVGSHFRTGGLDYIKVVPLASEYGTPTNAMTVEGQAEGMFYEQFNANKEVKPFTPKV